MYFNIPTNLSVEKSLWLQEQSEAVDMNSAVTYGISVQLPAK